MDDKRFLKINIKIDDEKDNKYNNISSVGGRDTEKRCTNGRYAVYTLLAGNSSGH
jgi:hypothetical protein